MNSIPVPSNECQGASRSSDMLRRGLASACIVLAALSLNVDRCHAQEPEDPKGIILRFITVQSSPVDGFPISLDTGSSSNVYNTPFTRPVPIQVTLTAPETHNGYRFVQWQEGATVISTDPSVVVTVGANSTKTVTVYYELIFYELNVEGTPGSGAKVGLHHNSGARQLIKTPYMHQYLSGDELILSAQLIWNCRPFSQWLYNGVPYSTDDVTTIIMDEDITMTAEFGDPGEPNLGLFSVPAALNTNAATDNKREDFAPSIATNNMGHWVAAWNSSDDSGGTFGTDRDIFFARSIDNGMTWTPSAPLNTSAATDSAFDSDVVLSTDGLGNWVAVWFSDNTLGGTIGSDFDILVARSIDNGASWTPPVALNTNAGGDSGADYYPTIANDGTGNWVAAWMSNDTLGSSIGPDHDILFARSSDNGASWTFPMALNTNADSDSGADYYPTIANDGTGNWIAAWTSNDTLSGTIGTDFDVLFARSSDNGASWTAPAPLNTNAASDSGSDGGDQIVCTDASGNWMALWGSDDTLGGTIGSDFDILAARSTDNGATWTDPAPVNTNAATDMGNDQIETFVTDGLGHWVAAWRVPETLVEDYRDEFDIHVARSSDNGTTWTDPAPLNTNSDIDSDSDVEPVLCTDGLGHWVAVWRSADSLCGTIGDDPDIFVATIDRATDTDGDGLADSSETNTGVYFDDWDTGTNPNTPDTLRVTKPNGGETWVRGRKGKIRWNSAGAVGDSVGVELWRKGKFIREIEGMTPNDGKLNWRVPDGLPPKKGYEILIRSFAVPAIEDMSDNVFRVMRMKQRM